MATSNLPESVMPTDRYRSSPSTTVRQIQRGILHDGFKLPRRHLMDRQMFRVLGIPIELDSGGHD